MRQNLSIEYKFFKSDGKAIKIYHLLFHRIWKKIYIHFFFSNFRGGLFGGYCGPPSFKGVCCVFVSGNCGKRFTEKISYFTNKSFPKSDIEPYQCLLSIKPLQNTCWVCVFNKNLSQNHISFEKF